MMDDLTNKNTSGKAVTSNSLSRQSRGAFIISLIALALALMSMIHIAYQAISGFSPQFFLLLASSSLTFFCALVAAILGRKGNSTAAGWILVLAISQMLIMRALIVGGDYSEVGIAGLILIIFLGARILPQSQMKWAAFLGILVLVSTRIFAAVSPLSRIELLAFDRVMQYLAWIILIFVGLLLAREFRLLSLTNKLILAFLMVSLVVSYAMNYFNSSRTEAALTEQVGQNLSGLAQSQAQAVGDLLNNQIENLLTLASSSTMQELAISSNLSYSDNPEINAQRIVEFEQQWSQAISNVDYSNDLIATRLNNKAAQELKQFVSISPYNIHLTLTDAQGGLAATSSLSTDYYQGDEYWWNASHNDGEGTIYISAPFYDRGLQKSIIYFSVPVVDLSTEELVGILQATYLMDGIAGIFSELQAGETSNVHLHIPSKPGFPTYPRIPTRVMIDGLLFTADMPSVERIAQSGDQRFGELVYQGQDSFYSWASVKSVSQNQIVDNLGWWLLTYQDRGEILAPVREQINQSGLLSSVIIAVVAGLALLLSQFLAGPIVRLTQAAEEIRKGDFTARANVETDDEVGTLATSFNEMTSQLRRTLQGLENQVQERTRELALAGQVGQSLSQERDLDRLLNLSVQMIQENFELYHTQIYLLDVTGKALVLRAATGEAGRELLQRAHRLPIGGGSINGLAASQRSPVLVSDTSASPIFRANTLLPETRSELAVPLQIGDHVVGVLDMQSSVLGSLSNEKLSAFEALAGQLAIAIENANLFSQAQQAQAEILNQSRQLTREGWGGFLDAIARKERIGFMYDRESMLSQDEELVQEEKQERLTDSIEIVGEPIGIIMLEKDPGHQWTESESNFVRTISAQVSRQIDNLRLLAQTEQFRMQAEDAVRRLTREGWDEYLETIKSSNASFTYNHLEVIPEAPDIAEGEAPLYNKSINVRNEPIGELVVEGAIIDDQDALDLIQTITDRLTAHIENLRLTAQTHKALKDTENLYEIISRLNSVQGYQEILDVLIENTILSDADQLVLMGVYDRALDDETQPYWCYPAAYRASEDIKVERRYSYGQFSAPFVSSGNDQIHLLRDLGTSDHLWHILALLSAEPKRVKSAVWVPLMLGSASIGFVLALFEGDLDCSESDLQHMNVLADQVAVAVQSQLLLDRARAKARQEQNIREVSAQVFSATDIHTIMKRTVEQVGRVLGSPAYIYLSDRQGLQDKAES